MKKTLTVLMMVLITAMLFVSCGEDPFFHTVSIKDGDKVVKTEIVRDGEEYTLPEKVDGIEVISGWTVDGKSYSAGEKIKITSDITITANKGYKVTFITGEGGSDVASQSVESGKTATKPADPTRTGYYLVRWSATENGETAFDFSTEITKDTTLYAVWAKVYKVGEKGPAGGWIFYDAGSIMTSTYKDKDGNEVAFTWRYLEAAPNDVSEKKSWGPSDKAYFTNMGIGTGKKNTIILENNGIDKFPAAQACADYGNGTKYDDWYLPSDTELSQMYEVLKKENKGGEWQNEDYWSSHDFSDNQAYFFNFSTGKYDHGSRSNSLCVRPIRAFV